jgi:hypothetical protein
VPGHFLNVLDCHSDAYRSGISLRKAIACRNMATWTCARHEYGHAFDAKQGRNVEMPRYIRDSQRRHVPQGRVRELHRLFWNIPTLTWARFVQLTSRLSTGPDMARQLTPIADKPPGARWATASRPIKS